MQHWRGTIAGGVIDHDHFGHGISSERGLYRRNREIWRTVRDDEDGEGFGHWAYLAALFSMSGQCSAPYGQRPVLSILIVNFNSTALLRRCLDAIAHSTIADQVETIVVDNASTDFDADEDPQRYPWVRWLSQATNTTYTGGNNIAFKYATSDLILMLNPDAALEPDALERAVAHMSASPELIGLGAYLVGPDGRLQRYYRRLPELIDVPVMLFEPLFRNTRRGRRFLMSDEPFDRPTPVENTPGAFTLLRRSATGDSLLDPGYFNFVSDLELCARLKEAGSMVVYPDVRCHHVRAAAGVGARDPRARVRLYHDFTWGIRRYFTARLAFPQRALLAVLLVGYWLVRIVRIAIASPQALPRTIATAAAAIAGRPVRY